MNQYQNYTLKNVTSKFLDTIKKTVFKAGATAEDGQEYAVSLWENDWKGADLKDGTVVKAEMKVSEKNGYKNWTLYPEKTKSGGVGMNGGIGMKAAQERKAVMIEQAQDRKNESIAFFNATNSAISIIREISKDIPFVTEKDYGDTIIRWREWFLKEWRKYEASEMQDKHDAI